MISFKILPISIKSQKVGHAWWLNFYYMRGMNCKMLQKSNFLKISKCYPMPHGHLSGHKQEWNPINQLLQKLRVKKGFFFTTNMLQIDSNVKLYYFVVTTLNINMDLPLKMQDFPYFVLCLMNFCNISILQSSEILINLLTLILGILFYCFRILASQKDHLVHCTFFCMFWGPETVIFVSHDLNWKLFVL